MNLPSSTLPLASLTKFTPPKLLLYRPISGALTKVKVKVDGWRVKVNARRRLGGETPRRRVAKARRRVAKARRRVAKARRRLGKGVAQPGRRQIKQC